MLDMMVMPLSCKKVDKVPFDKGDVIKVTKIYVDKLS